MKYLCDNQRHLVCIPYSIENLHKMANELGIKRCWFHKTHYDIPKKRIEEIQTKCQLVSPKLIAYVIYFKCQKEIHVWDGTITKPSLENT